MTKSNLILTLLALTQAVVVLCLTQFCSDQSDGVVDARAPVLDFDFDSVRSLELTADSGKESLSFSRPNADDSWICTSSAGFPVLTGKLGTGDEELGIGILDLLARAEVKQAIARSESSHSVLALAADNFDRRLTLKDEAGQDLAVLYLASGSRFNTCYLRRAGENEVYETDELSLAKLSMSATSFVGNTFVALTDTKINSITITSPDQTSFELSRELSPSPGPWHITGQADFEVDQETANDLARRLSELRIHEVLARAQELPSTNFLLQFEIQHEGLIDRISLNQSNQDGDYHLAWMPRANAAKSGYEVLVPSWSLGDIPSLTLDSLRAPPPEEEEN